MSKRRSDRAQPGKSHRLRKELKLAKPRTTEKEGQPKLKGDKLAIAKWKSEKRSNAFHNGLDLLQGKRKTKRVKLTLVHLMRSCTLTNAAGE